MRADIYIAGADPLSGWALRHRVTQQVEGEAVYFAPIEYVITSKLRYFQMGGSDRHLRDVARMIEVSGSDIDQPTLESWVERLKLGAEWARALALKNRDEVSR